MHLPTLLTLFLPTLALARGLPGGHNYDHDLEICVDLCNKFADGQLQYEYVCNDGCIYSSTDVPDPMCRRCALACRDEHKDKKEMQYCDTCYEKGPNPRNWPKGKGGKNEG